MTDTAYQILFRGFDCLVAPTEEGMFHVTLFEEGSHVFDTDVPIDLSQFGTEEEIDDNSDALINEAAQAAVDEFEAQRGSLGQGAGIGRQSMKKQAYWSSMDYADWYCTLKATPFKDQAESLLEQYFTAQRDQSCGNQDQAQARRMAEQKLANLEYELNMLNLQRMKCAKPNETIIVIKAYRSDKEACGTLLEEFLDGFRGTKFEDQALAKMKEYLDVKKQLEGLYETSMYNYRTLDDLRAAMDELYVNALQQEVSDSVVDNSGVGIDSNMAADVMSLMEGVTLDTDFEATNEMPPALFASKRAQQVDPAWVESLGSAWGELNSALEGGELEESDEITAMNMLANARGFMVRIPGTQFYREGPNGQVDIPTEEEIEHWIWALKSELRRMKDRFSTDNPYAQLKRTKGKSLKRSNKKAQDSAYMDEPSRPQDEVLQDALAMVKSMRKSDPATIKNTIKMVYGLSDKDASDLVSYGKRAEKEDKENDGEYEVVELGKIHEGIDPAEVPLKDFPFAIGDKVTLSKAFEMPIWGGGTTELAKGTKGIIKNLYDGHGDAYMVICEEGSTYCIPTEYLK